MRLAGISLEATDFHSFLLNSPSFPTLTSTHAHSILAGPSPFPSRTNSRKSFPYRAFLNHSFCHFYHSSALPHPTRREPKAVWGWDSSRAQCQGHSHKEVPAQGGSSRSDVIPRLIQCRFIWSRVSPTFTPCCKVRAEQTLVSVVVGKCKVIGKAQRSFWDWERTVKEWLEHGRIGAGEAWAEQGSLRAPPEPSWESQTTRDSSNAMIHLHPDHHTEQPFLRRELKQVHEELIPGPASSVSQKSLLDKHWLPSADGGKSCQKEKCIISLTNN